MKKIISTLSLFVMLLQSTYAQDKILQKLFSNVSVQSLKTNLYFLAGDKCEGLMVEDFKQQDKENSNLIFFIKRYR